MRDDAIRVEGLRHSYGGRVALDDVHFEVPRGQLFALLGPNGGGKTTLFRILSTLLRPDAGDAEILGRSVTHDPAGVRRLLGVVFQQPSLDGKLSVRENLICHGHLYAVAGAELRERADYVAERLGLSGRKGDYVETLSGGLQRRAELAKALLHRPPVLLLDEPSTGLDPGARRDFLQYVRQLSDEDGVTVVLTTHYMEEAERCDRIALLHRGRVVDTGTPSELKHRVGGDVVVVHTPEPARLAEAIAQRFGCTPLVVDGSVRVERERGHDLVRELVDAFPREVTLVTYGKPTLEDVFIQLTGHRFWDEGGDGHA
jgi:ABC-2 type transport system ATP-binding protein